MRFSSATISLPDEILSIICAELGKDRAFDTLYNCALSCRNVADPALRILYQCHELSPAFMQSDEENMRQANTSLPQKWKQAERSFRKWTILWRSIIASSLDLPATYKSYCRYLRILDFRNLVQMLEDLKFSNTIRKDFFKQGLGSFHFPQKEGGRLGIDVIATVNAVGEAVVPRTFQLEEIAGNLTSGFLARWISSAPRLKNIVLFQGDALNCDAGQAISANCESFESITIREWRSTTADETFAEFLDQLRPDSLQYFEMISFNSLQQQTFRALGKHKNLQELKLGNLSNEAVQNLNALKDCTHIHTLMLEDDTGTTQLEALNNDVFLDVVQWLSSCENLRDLTMKKFFDGPAILAQVVAAPNIRLKKLSLEGYRLTRPNTAAFHTALAEQQSLESLSLKGTGEDANPDDLRIMVEALSNLVGLRELVLKDISDEFEDGHIITLALHLVNLEEFWTSGDDISENALMMLARMTNLRTLTLLAVTRFSSQGIIDFICTLDFEKQQGFSLSLMAQHSDYMLTTEEQELIRAEIEKRLDGRFDYAVWREADSDDSDYD